MLFDQSWSRNEEALRRPERAVPGALAARRPLHAGARPGFTLIEVLVALVVLMLGIYGMVRIFPRGYSAIEAGQQRTVAAQLAEAEIARWELHPESLPDSIIATDYFGRMVPATLAGDWQNFQTLHVFGELAGLLPGTTNYSRLQLSSDQFALLDMASPALIYNPGDITSSEFDAALYKFSTDADTETVTSHPNWQPNSLYLPRTVIGERVNIRQLPRTQLGVPFHLLSHAPLDVLRKGDKGNIWLDIYDTRAFQYVEGDPWQTTLGQRQFALRDDALYVGPSETPAASARSFKVDYTDPATLQRVYGYTVTVPANAAGPGRPRLPSGVDPYSIQVYERFLPVLDREELTDPASRRNIYYVSDPETWISGRIEFPLVLQIDPQPTDILEVKIDYRVRDWGILVFDVEVPADGVVQLPIRAIKGPGYTNPPRQQRPQEVAREIKKWYDWEGNERQPDSIMESFAYVVAVDRQSGEMLTEHEGMTWPANPYERLARFRVNYRNGRLQFNYHDNPPEVPPDTWDDDLETNAWQGGKAMHSRSGRTYRIFCRGEADWAVQLMIAARQYARAQDGMPGGPPAAASGEEPARLTYAWRGHTGLRKQLFFPLSEAGQAVAIDYYTAEIDPERLVYVEGEVHTIGRPSFRDLRKWVCPLAEPLRHMPNPWGPVSVRGIGLRVRTLWVTQGQQATLQDIVAATVETQKNVARSEALPFVPVRPSLNESWHQEVISTYLTRTPL